MAPSHFAHYIPRPVSALVSLCWAATTCSLFCAGISSIVSFLVPLYHILNIGIVYTIELTEKSAFTPFFSTTLTRGLTYSMLSLFGLSLSWPVPIPQNNLIPILPNGQLLLSPPVFLDSIACLLSFLYTLKGIYRYVVGEESSRSPRSRHYFLYGSKHPDIECADEEVENYYDSSDVKVIGEVPKELFGFNREPLEIYVQVEQIIST